jgi:hypothetical protein
MARARAIAGDVIGSLAARGNARLSTPIVGNNDRDCAKMQLH